MIKKTYKTDAGMATHFVAERPAVVAPRELYRFTEDGVEYVYTECARTFIAARFDQCFNPPKGAVLPKNFKGRNPSKPLELFEDDMLFP